jgi:hypothetical protein
MAFKARVREATRRSSGKRLSQIVEALAHSLTEWRVYFGLLVRELEQ